MPVRGPLCRRPAALQTCEDGAMASADPLLQPFQLKHLVLKNRIMSTAHEPAYSEDGMP